MPDLTPSQEFYLHCCLHAKEFDADKAYNAGDVVGFGDELRVLVAVTPEYVWSFYGTRMGLGENNAKTT